MILIVKGLRKWITLAGGGGGELPIYDIVRMCGPYSHPFQRCQVYDKPPFSMKTVYD